MGSPIFQYVGVSCHSILQWRIFLIFFVENCIREGMLAFLEHGEWKDWELHSSVYRHSLNSPHLQKKKAVLLG